MDGNGSTFVDSGPLGLTVTSAGNATQVSNAGAFGGKALSLGANLVDQVSIAANAAFNLSTGYTIAMRVNLATVSGSIDALLDIGGAASGVSLRAKLSASDLYYYSNSFSPAALVSVPWVAGTFSQVELGFNGTTGFLFFDGVLVASQALSTTFGATPTLRIGQVLEGAH